MFYLNIVCDARHCVIFSFISGSRSYESEAENDVQLIDFRQLPTAITAGHSSSRASLAALTPPATPRRAATNKKLELRSADGLTASVVRSLYFADTFIVDGKQSLVRFFLAFVLDHQKYISNYRFKVKYRRL